MAKYILKIRRNRAKLILMIFMAITSLGMSQVYANDPIAVDHIVGDLTPPPETVVGDFTVGFVAEDGSDYVEATNTYFDHHPTLGEPNFYFLTGDEAYASQNGQLREIVRDSGTYQATIIYLPRQSFSANGLSLDDVSYLPTNFFSHLAGPSIARVNTTFFFDAGRFVDTSHVDTNNFSGSNTSIVGLYRDTETGDPLTIFFKAPAPEENRMRRYRFNTPNNYIENVIFDGSSINMVTPNGLASNSDRGSYYWVVGTNSGGFVARDVILQNIGAQNTSVNHGGILAGANGNQRNVALNILRATEGQRNFENLTIRNVMTTGGYGVVQLNNTLNNYFRNLNIINPNTAGTTAAQHANAHPIKIEHNITQAEIDNWLGGSVSNQQNIVFDGTLLVPNRGSVNDDIYIQDYRYQNILVPSDFAWALLRTSNGGNNTAAIRVYNHKRSAIALYAPLQLNKGYFFVEAAVTAPNFQTQINNINTVINIASPHTTVPAPRIKMIANNSNQLGGFTVPSFATQANIVALMQTDTPNTTLHTAGTHASGGTGTEFVPYIGGSGGIVFPSASEHLLFNFNFRTPAEWTIEDATTGGSIVNFTTANSGRNLFLRYLNDGYNITYVFMSGSTGMVLPPEVMGLLPPAILGVEDGTIHTSPMIPTTVSVTDGTWTFHGWDLASVTIAGSDETVTGIWVFTPNHMTTYDITYLFTSATEGMELPPEVMALLPPAVLGVEDGTIHTSPTIAPRVINVTGGTWTFQGWDLASVTIDGLNEIVMGTWIFIAETTQTPGGPSEPGNVLPEAGAMILNTSLVGLSLLIVGGIVIYLKYKKHTD